MKVLQNSITIGLLLCSCGIVNSYLEYDSGLSVELFHALDPAEPEKFTYRGNVTVQRLSFPNAKFLQESLGPKERNDLKQLANEDGFYRMKAIVIYSDGFKQEFMTTIKACAMVGSTLNDILWLSTDTAGSVLGINLLVTSTIECENVSSDELEKYTSSVFVRSAELAPVPDTTTFIQKMEREREARERGDVRDNRGFFAKYWMYIVPVVLLVLLSGATTPEVTGGGR